MKKNMRNWVLIGLALVLAFTLTVSLPGSSQAQQNDSAVAYGPPAQDYGSSYYGYNGSGHAYCPMGPGYGYSAPAKSDYRRNYQHASRSWNSGSRGAWCPWNSGYARGNRRGWSCW